MHPSLIWLMTVAWPLEDLAFKGLSQEDRDDWTAFYQRISKHHGIYYPFAQTCWY